MAQSSLVITGISLAVLLVTPPAGLKIGNHVILGFDVGFYGADQDTDFRALRKIIRPLDSVRI